MTARQFSDLYNLVAKISQDESANGIANAKVGINNIIKELTREFKLPQMFKGQDNTHFVTPLQNVVGTQIIDLSDTDIINLSNVWYVESGTIYELECVDSDDEWLRSTDTTTDGEPKIFRYFNPGTGSAKPKIHIWPSPNSGWFAQAGTLLYTYWAQLVQLSADADIPNIPYEHDNILVNGGITEVARMQGDNVMLNLYLPKYEDDKGELRAWIIKQATRDGQMEPAEPIGQFGKTIQRGYRQVE